MFPSSHQRPQISTPTSQTPPSSPIEKASQVSFSSIKLHNEDLEAYWSCSDCSDPSSEASWHTCPECHELQRLLKFDGEGSLLDTRITLDEVMESRLSARSRHRTRSLSPSKVRDRSRSRTRLKSRSHSEERGDTLSAKSDVDNTDVNTQDRQYIDIDKFVEQNLPHIPDQQKSKIAGEKRHFLDDTIRDNDQNFNDFPLRSLERDESRLRKENIVTLDDPKYTLPLDRLPISYFPQVQVKDTTSNMESMSSGYGEASISLEAESMGGKTVPEMPLMVGDAEDLCNNEKSEHSLKDQHLDLQKQRPIIPKKFLEISLDNQPKRGLDVQDEGLSKKASVHEEKDTSIKDIEEGSERQKKVHFNIHSDRFNERTVAEDVTDKNTRSTVDNIASGSTPGDFIPEIHIPRLFEDEYGRQPVLELLQKSAEWLELRVVELNPGLAFLGSNLEEAKALQIAHQEVLTKLQGKQSPVEDLLNQADQLIATQRPKAEVYASMAESLGLAWKDLNAHLETRKELLDLSVSFHTRARQYSDALDEAEKIYTDNLMPSEVDDLRQLLNTLQEKKRLVLEASMHTLQEANILLMRLRGLLKQGGTMDSRPYRIKTSIEFACSQIEHQLEALHDRRKFLDGLFATKKVHLEQCLSLCILYQDLTDVVLNLKSLRDEISAHQSLGESQVSSEILLHEHLRREEKAKNLQDLCIRHVRSAEQMVATGHYAGTEARARSYSVLEAASALHDTCSTRIALLEQSALFFKLANTSLNKLDQAEIQVAGLDTGVGQRLSTVIGLVEEAVQPALTEGYAILEVTGGRGHSHNEGITRMVEHLEKRRSYLSSLCEHTTEQALQRTELINSFLDQFNSINNWLVRIGDAFLQGHQDPGGSLSLAKDFYHLHQTLKSDISEKKQDIDALERFLQEIEKDLPDENAETFLQNIKNLMNHWANLTTTLESRILLCEIYVRFHEDAEKLQNKFEKFEEVLRKACDEQDNEFIEGEWQSIQKSFSELNNTGKEFIAMADKIDDQSLDVNRALICIKSILDNFGKKKLVISDLHSHFKMRISISKELSTLWKTYRENLKKMDKEMTNLEESFCPLLRGDNNDPEGIAISLEYRLSNFINGIKKIQEGIEAMVTKAEGHAHNEDANDERSDVVRSLLQLYQNLQNKVTDYQILGTMLCQWCRNIAEIQKLCDKLEKQFSTSLMDIRSPQDQIKENGAAKQTILELIQFANNEASPIFTKIRNKCPVNPGEQDIDTMEKLMERRKHELENIWTERQVNLENQLKRSQYQSDLQVISEQLHDLSEQLSNMKGRYGDSLPAALQMKTAFTQFKLTVDMLEKRIQSFVSSAEKMLGTDGESEETRMELEELNEKWYTFIRQVGESQKNIDLSIEYFQLVQEAEDWFRQGSELLVDIAGKSSQIHSPEDAIKLRQIIDNFLHPGEGKQYQRLKSISSLAILLYGQSPPEHVANVTKQNVHMIDSFSAINGSISTLVDNLRQAEDEKARQGKEQEEMVASLAAAQADAEAARLAAIAADDARKDAEEVARIMASTPKPIAVDKVEVTIQTESIPISTSEIIEQHQKTYIQEEEYITSSSDQLPPVFITPLVSATVLEGVKFTFECRLNGYPIPNVQWLKDGLSIMSNTDYKTSHVEGVCALSIEETLTEDSALFTCRAENTSGTAETCATLTVKESPPSDTYSSPVFTKRLQDASAKEGSKLELNCTVTGHPLPVVTWTKNDIVIDSSPDYVIIFNNGECILRFEELFLEDTAEYICRAFNDHGEDVTQAKLSVSTAITSVKPLFIVPLSNIMARAGQKFKLECHIKGTPSPTVTWFHNGKPVKETPDCKITFDGTIATLLMSEAFPKNAGVYTAVAKNTAGENQSSSNVSVKGRIPTETSDSEMTSDADAEPIKPTIQLLLKDTTIKEGDTVRLDCVIVGHPEPEVIWYHNNKPVKEAEDFKLLFHGDRCSLVIQEAYVEDGGGYKVVAMNSAGEASTACILTVKEAEVIVPIVVAPHFLQLLTDCHVCENEPVHMTAKVEGSPFPTITWFKDSIPLLPDNDLEITQLEDGSVGIEIANSALEHTGQYEIVATNSAGSAKSIAFLSIEQYLPPKPSENTEPPMFIKTLEDKETYSGESMIFEVEVSGKPKPLITWTINDYPLTGTEYQSGERQYFIEDPKDGLYCLRFPSCSKVQSGTIKVTAENFAGKSISSCYLKIKDKPHIAPKEDEFNKETVISESHFSQVFSSSTADGQPSSKSFSSYQNSQISSGTDQPIKEIYETKVQKITQEADESPLVSAKVTIKKFENRKPVEEINEELDSAPSTPTRKSIRKAAPARFITPLQGVIAQEEEKVVLVGTIDGFPQPSIEWTHNGGPLPDDATPSVKLNKVSLLLPTVHQRHSGRYTCVLENSAGSAQCTCDIVVKKTQFPPVFSRRLQPAVVGIGSRLNLEVDVSGTPTPSVKWLKNEEQIYSVENLQIKSDGTRHWLTIPKANAANSGRYGVIATNAAGRAESLADVIISDLVSDSSSQIIVYTEVQDDIRGEPVIEEGHVQKLKKDYLDETKTSSLTTDKILTHPSNDQKEIPELPHIPGKLRAEWPPPPSEEDKPLAQKIDAALEISKDTVSSAVSIFKEFEVEPSDIFTLKQDPVSALKSNSDRPISSNLEEESVSDYLIPGPQPEYGYISQTTEPYSGHTTFAPINITSHQEYVNNETLQTPDNVTLQIPVVANLYGEINKIKPTSTTDEMKPKLIETKTEKEINETNITEVQTTITSSEKTVVATKVVREYDDPHIREIPSDISLKKVILSPSIEDGQSSNDKNKRESVKQIAIRLEESIAPLSAEDVPRGIRTFPSPSIQIPVQEDEHEIEEPSEDSYMPFPKLEPFPFKIDTVHRKERAKVPPPPKPRKFTPGIFSDGEIYSESELSPIDRFQLKSIKFEPPKNVGRKDISNITSPAPPSTFDCPPNMESMRPVILTKNTLKDDVIEYPAKKELPIKKPPKIVQKFLAKTQTKDQKTPKVLRQNVQVKVESPNEMLEINQRNILSLQHEVVETSLKSTINTNEVIEEEQTAHTNIATEMEKVPLRAKRGNISETEASKPSFNINDTPMSIKSHRISWPLAKQNDKEANFSELKLVDESITTQMTSTDEKNFGHLLTKPVYWSSNVSLTETQGVGTPSMQLSVTANKFEQENYSSLHEKKNFPNISGPTEKNIAKLVSTPKLLKKSIKEKQPPIRQNKSVRKIPEMQVEINFDLDNKLQPFPFDVPKSDKTPRKATKTPPKPKRFIPGAFAESDYESDYEGKPPSIWRPYASDSETNEYRPIKVKLKQGRTRALHNKSPPAPSEFDVPPNLSNMLNPSLNVQDYPEASISKSTKFEQKKAIDDHKLTALPANPIKSLPIQRKTDKQFPPSGVGKLQQMFEQGQTKRDDSDVIAIKETVHNRPYQTLPRSTKFHAQSKTSTPFVTLAEPTGVPTPQLMQIVPATKLQMQSSTMKREDECGYTADTESTLPRRVKSLSENQTFSKNESFISSSTFSMHQNQQTKMSSDISFMHKDDMQDPFQLSQTMSAPINRTVERSSNFSSSESKTSKVNSTRKEELFESKGRYKESPESKRKIPKFHEFRKDTTGSGTDNDPYDERTYYSMSDESEVITDRGKTKSKIEMKTESHVSYKTDKKTEKFSASYQSPTHKNINVFDNSNVNNIPRYNKDYQHSKGFFSPSAPDCKIDTKEFNLLSGQFSTDLTNSKKFIQATKTLSKDPSSDSAFFEKVTDLKSAFLVKEEDQKLKQTKPEKDIDKTTYSMLTPERTFEIPELKIHIGQQPQLNQNITKDKYISEHKPNNCDEQEYRENRRFKKEPKSLGVESTKSLKMSDSSPLHRRVISLEQTTRLIKFGDPNDNLQPFPFTPEPKKPKREKNQPPPQPKKFERNTFKESDYESDFDERIKPTWQPQDSDAEEPYYTAIKYRKHQPTPRKDKVRTPTPPFVFDTPPTVGEPMRPDMEEIKLSLLKSNSDAVPTMQIDNTDCIRAPMKLLNVNAKFPALATQSRSQHEEGRVHENVDYIADTVNVKLNLTPERQFQQTYVTRPYHETIEKTETKTIEKEIKSESRTRTNRTEKTTTSYLYDDSESDIGYTPNVQNVKGLHKTNNDKGSKELDSIQINIDICDSYDLQLDSDEPSMTVYSDGLRRVGSGIHPTSVQQDNQKSIDYRNVVKGPVKFVKGSFKESDYESDYDSKILSKWGPSDSESESCMYRRVYPPRVVPSEKVDYNLIKSPSPPSKFDNPPLFEGPPRPSIDMNAIPVRERRESLDEYSVAKFPVVEFKPFDIEDYANTNGEIKKKDSQNFIKPTKAFADQQFQSMTQDFRNKAHQFADQLVSEVFSGKEPDDIGKTTETENRQIPIASSEPNDIQTYRDHSRASEFGTKHIDPDTGLIYFKYDFGYEFGIVLPGEKKKQIEKKDLKEKKGNGEIEIPVIHIPSDDEFHSLKPSEIKNKIYYRKEYSDEGQDYFKQLMFLKPLSNKRVREADKLVLECVVQAESPLKVFWTQDGSPIDNADRRKLYFNNGVCRMVIQHVEKGDSGTYQCTIENHYGKRNCSCELTVEPVRQRPSDNGAQYDRIPLLVSEQKKKITVEYLLHIYAI